jgi:NAD(P)-dependent dehydrogenase (short-subunit alcohol dehydrogenase family)
MRLNDRVAIITGGAQGIGRATAERFVQAGAAGVAIVDLRTETLKAAATEIMGAHGGEVLPVTADVSDPQQVKAAVAATMERFGRIDILVNNAGIMTFVPWDDVTLESWEHVLRVNLTSMFLFSHAVLPIMRARKYGRLVYISSEGAFGGSGTLIHPAYGVAKAGVITLMRTVASSFASEGILANAIAPGPIETPMGHSQPEDVQLRQGQRTMLKRRGSAYEIADAVLFLVSDRSTYITAQVLRVNGGAGY